MSCDVLVILQSTAKISRELICQNGELTHMEEAIFVILTS